MVRNKTCFITLVVPGHPRGCERCRMPDPVDTKNTITARATESTKTTTTRILYLNTMLFACM